VKRYRLFKRLPALPVLGVVLLAALSAAVYAQVGGGFDLSWSTVDGGGGTFSAGGPYSLGGTIGQPDAGSASGGQYQLNGGFWAAGDSTSTPSVTPSRTTSPTGSPTRTSTPPITSKSTRTNTPTN